MFNPVNTSPEEFIRKKIKLIENHPKLEKGVSVITVTNRPHLLENILENFLRQDIKEKELIIIINNNKINLNEWKNRVKGFNNIRIYQLDENISLGKCLNFGIKKTQYPVIAKFDDDDYYGPKYLSDSMKYLDNDHKHIIGKHTIFTYFIEEKELAIKDPGYEYKYVSFINGATMIFKKNIFNKVRFRDVSVSEDMLFCKDCIKNGIKIYSINRYHFAYLRYPNSHVHTWRIKNKSLMKLFCTPIGKMDDFKKYIDV